MTSKLRVVLFHDKQPLNLDANIALSCLSHEAVRDSIDLHECWDGEEGIEQLLQPEMLILASNPISSRATVANWIGGCTLCVGTASGAQLLLESGRFRDTRVPATLVDACTSQSLNVLHDDSLNYASANNCYVVQSGIPTIELLLQLIAAQIGPKSALEMAPKFGVAQSRLEILLQKADSRQRRPAQMARVVEWAEANINRVESVDCLAQQACLSRRSFDRHFKKEMGISPKKWLLQKKTELAKDYLLNSDLSIEDVAEVAGFGCSNNLRNSLNRFGEGSPSCFRNGVYK